MTRENNAIFFKWMFKKYNLKEGQISDFINSLDEDKLILEQKEFKKYHPKAGVFVECISMDDFLIIIKNFKYEK